MVAHSGNVALAEADRFVPGFLGRVRAAREATGMTQAQMALVLGIKQSAYEKYETRTPLPHHLIKRFAAVTGVDVEELFERGDPGAAVPEREAKSGGVGSS